MNELNNVSKLIANYRKVSAEYLNNPTDGNLFKVADVETKIVSLYLSRFNMPEWVRDIALDSDKTTEEVGNIIAELK